MTDYTHARFWKCALQVNPHGYMEQYRGQDHGMDATSYAEALRDACIDNGIQVVGFADHGSVEDSELPRKILSEAGIVVFPGFEVVTTEKVHWVCLFSEDTSEQKLERYLGNLRLTDPKDGVRPSRLGGEDLLRIVSEELGGFTYAAHIIDDKGVLRQKCNHLWKNQLLRAAQIKGQVDDLPQEYRPIALNKNPDYFRDQSMAFINAKDVAKPEDMELPSASTYIKMTRPCFASFLMAFKDIESRIRLSSQMVERHYSQINSITIENGYLDDLSVELSGHLNTVIGGRGTGKSTLLECIRYTLDLAHKGNEARKQSDQIIKGNLGDSGGRVTLKLLSATNHMKPYTVVRRYGEPPRVIDESGNESHLHPARDLLPSIDIYSQNEIFELARDESALAGILDRFLPEIDDQKLADAYRKLAGNSEQLGKALDQKEEAERQIAQLPKLEEQVKQFREQGLEEKLKQVPLLERERQLSPRLTEEISRARRGKSELVDSLPDTAFLSDKALEGLPHANLLVNGRTILEDLDKNLNQKVQEIYQTINEADDQLNIIVNALNEALKNSEAGLEKDFANIPTVAGKDGKAIGRTYQQLLRQIEEIRPVKSKTKSMDSLVAELEQNRRNILGEISDMRSEKTQSKQRAIKELNKKLKGKVKVTLFPDGLRQSLRDFLQDLPGVGAKKTEWVTEAEGLTIPGLVNAIREGKEALLDKGWGLTSSVAESLSAMPTEKFYELEGIDLQDTVLLDLNVSHDGENYRDIKKLSTGQQCTAILHLLLIDNQDPLIMDQPEDNLDNAFIAERIVQDLRIAKTERQFLFATHNANIPVFGDAEWIGVLSVSDGQAKMPPDAQGSIDTPEIRDQAAQILEGGKEAFMQRKDKYGLDY